MPVPISCPGCNRKLNLPDSMVGKRVKCPGCGTSFPANPPAAAPQDPFGGMEQAASGSPFEQFDETAASSKKPIPGDAAAWDRTRTGLTMLMLGGYIQMADVIIFLATALISATGILGPFMRDADPESAMMLYFGCLGFIGISSIILNVVGLAFGINAPSEGGTKPLAITAVVLEGITLLSSCMGFKLLFAIVPLFFGLISRLLILFYLRACSHTVNNRSAARGAVSLMIGMGVLVFGTCAAFFLMVVLGGVIGTQGGYDQRGLIAGMGLFMIVLAALFWIMVIVWLVKYVSTISGIRTTIDRHLLSLQ